MSVQTPNHGLQRAAPGVTACAPTRRNNPAPFPNRLRRPPQSLSFGSFYGLRSDPHENRNENANPKYADTISELKAELKRQREELTETDESRPHIQKVIEANFKP